MLNRDLMDEVEAILVYMRNSFVEGGCLPSRVAEEIARDEMRHAEWLAEIIVDLGGVPSLEHRPLAFGGESTAHHLRRMVEMEQGAINQYREHIEKIPHEEIRRKLRHILEEEIEHHETFTKLLAEIEGDKEVD